MNKYYLFLKRKIKRLFLWPILASAYLKDYFLFIKLAEKNKRFELRISEIRPFLHEKIESLPIELQYTYHPAWAARIIAKIKPDFHVDISSLFYFSTIISAFVPVKFYEYRKVNVNLENLFTGSADLTALPFKDNSIKSLSCMHTVEHLGLGRYGDILDYDGDLKAIRELKRVLADGGSLLFAVPIGRPRIEFNAHRIYSYDQIMEYFSDLELIEFSLISIKEGKIIKNATKEITDNEDHGCGCFWFKK